MGEHLEEHDTHAKKSVFSDISRNLPSWDLKKWESKGNHLKNAMFAKKQLTWPVAKRLKLFGISRENQVQIFISGSIGEVR